MLKIVGYPLARFFLLGRHPVEASKWSPEGTKPVCKEPSRRDRDSSGSSTSDGSTPTKLCEYYSNERLEQAKITDGNVGVVLPSHVDKIILGIHPECNQGVLSVNTDEVKFIIYPLNEKYESDDVNFNSWQATIALSGVDFEITPFRLPRIENCPNVRPILLTEDLHDCIALVGRTSFAYGGLCYGIIGMTHTSTPCVVNKDLIERIFIPSKQTMTKFEEEKLDDRTTASYEQYLLNSLSDTFGFLITNMCKFFDSRFGNTPGGPSQVGEIELCAFQGEPKYDHVFLELRRKKMMERRDFYKQHEFIPFCHGKEKGTLKVAIGCKAVYARYHKGTIRINSRNQRMPSVDNTMDHEVQITRLKVHEVSGKTDLLLQDMGEVKERLGNVEQDMDEVKKKLGNVEQDMDEVKERLGNLEEKVEKGFKNLEDKIDIFLRPKKSGKKRKRRRGEEEEEEEEETFESDKIDERSAKRKKTINSRGEESWIPTDLSSCVVQ